MNSYAKLFALQHGKYASGLAGKAMNTRRTGLHMLYNLELRM